MVLSVDEYSMELFENHQQLYKELEDAKNILDPVVEKINKKEILLNSKRELEALLKDPTRLTDKRNSFKKYLSDGVF